MQKTISLLLMALLVFCSFACAAESVEAQPGEEVTVTLTVDANPSIAVAATMNIEYDHAALELIPNNSVQNDSTFLLDLNGIAEGTAISITFRVLPEALGGEYPVSLRLKEAGTIDEIFVDDLAFSVASIAVAGGTQPAGAADYAFEEVNGRVRVTKYLGTDTHAAVPERINGLPVAEIGSQAFKGCDQLESVVVPEGVEIIGKNAFHSCRSLRRIDLPDTVTSIGVYAFFGCSALEEVHLSAALSQMGEYAFASCQSLKEVTVPGSLNALPISAFMSCGSLRRVTVLPGVTRIGQKVFYNCVSLTEVSLPEGLTVIESNAFFKCKSLEEIVIPETVEMIQGNVFSGCDSLVSVTVLGNASTTDGHVFDGCTGRLVVRVRMGSPMYAYCGKNGVAFEVIED